MAENGDRWIKRAGIIMTIAAAVFVAILALGMDRGQLRANTRIITDNTLSIRNLEQSQAAVCAQLDALKSQNERIANKIDHLTDIIIER